MLVTSRTQSSQELILARTSIAKQHRSYYTPDTQSRYFIHEALARAV